jgi:hypothetical protein
MLTLLIVLMAVHGGLVAAQDDDAVALTAGEPSVERGIGIYGQEVLSAVGELRNEGETAVTEISLLAEVYDAEGELIGEGIGVLVNACGAGLLPDFTLQPGSSHAYAATLDLFEQDAEIDRVEISATGRAVPRLETSTRDLPAGITQVSDQEVVMVEWQTPRVLRFASGCVRDLFNEWTWQTYNTRTGSVRAEEHPRAALVDAALQERLRLTDPLIFANSFLRYQPDGERMVFQNAVNYVYTAAADGTLQRELYRGLHNRTLQGITWLPEGRFLAYYYGAFGDEVIYFTADAEGRHISPNPNQSVPSVIVPGPSLDGRRVVIAGTFDGVTGYYLDVLTNDFFELLFEAELPGNNWPAPLPLLNEAGDLVQRVYVARDVDGQARLQCFNRDQGVLHDLAPLPLQLADDERAWWWPSPDLQTLALGANGVHGGLWTIDLAQLGRCE